MKKAENPWHDFVLAYGKNNHKSDSKIFFASDRVLAGDDGEIFFYNPEDKPFAPTLTNPIDFKYSESARKTHLENDAYYCLFETNDLTFERALSCYTKLQGIRCTLAHNIGEHYKYARIVFPLNQPLHYTQYGTLIRLIEKELQVPATPFSFDFSRWTYGPQEWWEDDVNIIRFEGQAIDEKLRHLLSRPKFMSRKNRKGHETDIDVLASCCTHLSSLQKDFANIEVDYMTVLNFIHILFSIGWTSPQILDYLKRMEPLSLDVIDIDDVLNIPPTPPFCSQIGDNFNTCGGNCKYQQQSKALSPGDIIDWLVVDSL